VALRPGQMARALYRCEPRGAGPARRHRGGRHLSGFRCRLSRDARGDRDRGSRLLPRRGRQAAALPRLPQRGSGVHSGAGCPGRPEPGRLALSAGCGDCRARPGSGSPGRLKFRRAPPCRALGSAKYLIQLVIPESHTIDMTQGPDNNRPEPYFSPRKADTGARPAPGAPGASSGPAVGPASGPAPGQAGSRPPRESVTARGAAAAGAGAPPGPAGPGPAPSGSAGPAGAAAPAGGRPMGAQAGSTTPRPAPQRGAEAAGETAPAGDQAPAGQAAPDPGALEALAAELAEAEARAAANQEQYLRAMAETE